ncbi:hypothetical protein EDD37DRAFT_617553 [Exophiala viscosa]|uniref:uncharacterized protein n=1 Tax=Exophiala viscosa TaxID=2486360 RepID=UPI00218E187A|nr:hypothetical protein EDD37DRAFT_617553 [Exophiala viscosa]
MIATGKATLPHEDSEARPQSRFPSVDAVDDLDSFKSAARTLLSIHRDEIAQRDEHISKLRAELLRVREGLQALENQSLLGQPLQDVADHSDKEWTFVQSMYAPELGKESQEQVSGRIENIWASCLKAVQDIMAQDAPLESILDMNNLGLQENEQVMTIVELLTEPSDAAFASRTRTVLVLALLAKALEEYILTPNYLLEDDNELRYILSKMTDTKKKAHFRGLLLSISEEDGFKEPVRLFRVENALDSITKPLEAVYQEDFRDKLRSRLEQLLEGIMTAWEPAQHCESHLEVSTMAKRDGREWRTLRFEGDTANLVTVKSDAFEADPVLMTLFPRVCIIDRSKKPAFTTVFPGVVFQRSQATVEVADVEVKSVEIPGVPTTELVAMEQMGGVAKENAKADEADSRITGSESEGSSASSDETEGSETESNDGDEEA